MALKDELELFYEIISKTINPKEILKQGLSDVLFNQLNKLIVDEYEQIRKRLKYVHYSRDKERLKEQYVQQHQIDIIELMNRMVEYIMPSSPEGLIERDGDTNLEKLYKRILQYLQELLEFIERHLSKYFNQDADVPVSYLLLSQGELRVRIKKIKKKLSLNIVSKEIASFILSPISALGGTHKAVSYRKFLYIKELMNELDSLPLNPLPKEGDLKRTIVPKDSVIEMLYYMNFNCSKLFHHLVEKAVQTINSIHDQKEKLIWLYESLKELNQLQVKPEMKLIADKKGLRDEMVNWMEEEIFCLEKRETLFSMAPAADVAIKDEDKIHFNVPEPVLSLLGRSALDVKLVANKIKKKVFETIAKVATTSGSENPKPGSLIKKSYDPERHHKEKAIGILHEMIRKIMQY